MSDSSSDRDPLDVLAEEFVTRFRAGQRPSLTEYAQRRPDLADQIRELFPTLIEMEQLRPDSANQTGPFTSHASPPAPDRLGDFRILREIGRGGMGVVYEAVQESLGRHVALKVLPPAALDDPRRLERFRREAQAAARLHHTNIVPVFDSGEADGRHFFAMQFIQGQGLDTIIAEVRRLKSGEAGASPVGEVATALTTGEFAPPADTTPTSAPTGVLSGSFSDAGGPYWVAVARVGTQAADALAHAHEQGVLHRDIKPSNLLLDRHGTLWVTDFGLAKAAGADDLTAAGDVVGTLRYLAPERFEGPGDHRADLYALGLTLYELLTLRPAFTADSRPQLVEQVLAANPAKPRAVNRAVPRDLETIVLKATAKDLTRRYQSAAALAEDLRRYLDDRPVLARRAGGAEQAWRWCRRNPAVAALLAAVLLVFAAGAGVSAYFAVQENAKATEAANREQDAKDARDVADGERKKTKTEAEKVRAALDTARRLLHVSQINQAQSALAEDRVARATQLLADTTPQKPEDPDLRGWEWYYLDRQLRGRVIAEFAGNLLSIGPIENPAVSQDGRAVMSRQEGDGQILEVWDLRAARKIARLPKDGTLSLAMPTPRFTLAPDGRYVAAVTAEPPVRAGAPPRQRIRLWEVETAAELPGPPESPPSGTMMKLAAGAAGIIWSEWSLPPGRGSKAVGILVRWERASGAMTRTPVPDLPDPQNDLKVPGKPPDKNLVAHTGGTGSFLAPDGRTLFRFANFGQWVKVPAADGKGLERERHDAESYLDCWDLTASPPRRRWPTVCLAKLLGDAEGKRTDVRLTFSPGWASVAAASGKDVAVYRLADGKELWRAPLTPAGQLFGVSDDGKRVAFQELNRLTILIREGTAAPRELVVRYGGSKAILSADGRTVLTEPEDNRIRVLNVARDPDMAVLGDVGRLAVIRPAAAPGGVIVAGQVYGGPTLAPCLVVDADGREVVRIAAPAAGHRMFARLVADDRRLLTVTVMNDDDGGGTKPNGAPKDPDEWALYDLTRPGEPRRVGGGPGKAVAVPGASWLAVTTLTAIKKVQPKDNKIPAIVREYGTALHDALTGQRVREVPPDHGPLAFDPAGARYATITWPPYDGVGNPYRRHGAHTLRTFEAATGRELWSADLGDLTWANLGIHFSPDGRRLFASASGGGMMPNGPSKLSRVWVLRADDGGEERTLELTADRPEMSAPRVVGVTSSGRLIAQASGPGKWRPEVQLWDPDTGQRTNSLTGPDTGIAWAATTPDGSRLFVLAGTHLHLWDLTVGRELLVIPIPLEENALGPDGSRGVWFDGQRVLIPGMKGVRAFDGSPMGP